ncbi:MAG: hypothetical protein JXQ29_06805 [Planctomycetes bacterium]|nr:hypothetical protein [Planctomycetota bacterium]
MRRPILPGREVLATLRCEPPRAAGAWTTEAVAETLTLPVADVSLTLARLAGRGVVRIDTAGFWRLTGR